MDLITILEKTKKKSESIVILRKPPSIATEDRPYLQKDKKRNANKPEINQRQSEDKLETNKGRTKDKLETNQGQTKDKLRTNSKQTRDKTEDKTEDKLRTNWRHKNTNVVPVNSNFFFSSLVGLQRSLVFVIFNECKINRTKITNPISIEYLAKACNSTVLSIKKSIQRLEKKGIISRSTFKNGRSGWTKYELPENIYKEIILNSSNFKFDGNWGQTGDKLETELETKVRTIISSSNSNYKTTTTLGRANPSLWDLNITPIANIGFTQKHLEQISKRTAHSPEDVQEAIYAFSHDLENNKLKIRNGNDPLSFFMGIMGKGDLYLPSADYVNPNLKASQLYLEKREAYKAHCKKLDDELRAESFEQWSRALSEDEKERILPEEVKNSPFKPHIHSSLLAYHRKAIWPEIRSFFYDEKGIPLVELEFESEDE